MLNQQLISTELTDIIPADYKLGESRSEINIESLEENTTAMISLAGQACRNINIFTQDLDSELYGNVDFVSAISQMIHRDKRTVVRILVHDTISAIKSEHRLFEFTKSMPGSIFIRNPTRLYQHIRCSYMVADSLGYIYREKTLRDDYGASVNFMSPRKAATLDESFMEIWERSTVDRHVKRLYR